MKPPLGLQPLQLWAARNRPLWLNWQHWLQKDNQEGKEKINQHTALQLLLNPSGPHNCGIQSQGAAPRHSAASRNLDDKFSLGKEPNYCVDLLEPRPTGLWSLLSFALQLICLAFFIQAGTKHSFSAMARSNRGRNKTFLILTVISKLLHFKVGFREWLFTNSSIYKISLCIGRLLNALMS